MTDIEIHGVLFPIETLPLERLQQLKKHTTLKGRIISSELRRRETLKTTSISELALAMQVD